MSKTRASEELLGRLHAKLAKVMTDALEPIPVINPDTEEVINTIPCVNPALFTAVAKFLKDNEITAVPEAGSAIDSLKNKMQEQRAKRQLPRVEAEDAQFGRQTTLQ
jgi:hypothetical protein